MSTKSTISHNEKYHLYQECYEQDNVWLQIDDVKELEVRAYQHGRDLDSPTTTQVNLAIPVDIWRHAVDGWMKSHWAQHPEFDNKPISFLGENDGKAEEE